MGKWVRVYLWVPRLSACLPGALTQETQDTEEMGVTMQHVPIGLGWSWLSHGVPALALLAL